MLSPWRLSNRLDTGFCVEGLDPALETEQPLGFINDQRNPGARFEPCGVLRRRIAKKSELRKVAITQHTLAKTIRTVGSIQGTM